MTKKVTVLAVVVVAALGAALFAQKAQTVSGTLVDLKCYKAGGFKGNEHMGNPTCGTMCAKSGIPVAILDAKGNVNTILAPAPQFADHIGKEARVTGKVDSASRTVIPGKVEVKSNGTWREVKAQAMM